MENKYQKHLENKGTENFWKKAKQYEYNDADKIVFSLENFKELTTRNSMSLRLIGFVENLGNDNLKLTKAGKMFLNSKNKQEVLDEQLLKIYLKSEINNRLNIPVFPLGVIYSIYTKLAYITFEEYKIFVCWINDNKEIPSVVSLIEEYRKKDRLKRVAIEKIYKNKILKLGIKNFDDNIYRLFTIFTLSSYIRSEGSRYKEIIYRNSKPGTYKALVNSLKKIRIGNYIHDLIHYKGIITQKADYEYILSPIQSLSNEDRDILFKQIIEKKSLPDIRNIVPTIVSHKIIKRKGTVRRLRNKVTKKIDYVARDTRNRLIGLHAEKIVYKYEYNRLAQMGRNDLAQNIVHESLINDNLGYDITSYDIPASNKVGDSAKHIEVKAVSGLPRTFSFFISKNELEKVKNDPAHKIYIVFNYETLEPQIWPLPHSFNKQKFVEIDPVKFQVTLTIER
ncbi:MAG: AlwI family type II restriction endonuclease [Candidatus Liptonbacteria bacterium]|nr:AlwI family type II restriction endonuclease [Candidatus Liptonbacteria bacterium]